jgi:hypothetical protein
MKMLTMAVLAGGQIVCVTASTLERAGTQETVTFENAIPATSNERNPKVFFNKAVRS